MKNFTKLRSVYALLIFIFIAHIFTSFSTAPAIGRTGAPGDNGSCLSCHGGSNAQGLDGTLQILGLPAEVTPNTTYRITVEVANPNGLSLTAGMQMTALTSDDLAAGTFSNPSTDAVVQVQQFNQRNYLGHNPAMAYNDNRVASWSVDWTSPAEPDPEVTFYAVGNVTDMDTGTNTANDLIIFETQSTVLVDDVVEELPDLTASNVQGFTGTFEPDDVVEFSWDLNNFGTAIAVEGYRIAMHLSADNQFSADDPFVGEVPTGNTFPGTIPNVPGAIRIPLDAEDGDYFLHFLVDADNTIIESDENNNLLTTTSTITVGTPMLEPVDVALDAVTNACQNFAVIQATASGGTMDYTYLWSTQATTGSITVFDSDTYSVTVTDSDGISAENSITLEIPDILTAEENIILEPAGNQLGVVQIVPSGGTSPFAYIWPDGTTESTNTNLSAGTFLVTVTDANGCMTTVEFTLDGLSDITLSSAILQLTCSDSADAAIEVVATGGTGNYTYLWSTQATTSSIGNLEAGPYSVTVSDGASEDVIANFIITAIEPIQLIETITNVLCNGDATGAVSVLAIGGTGPYTYLWNNGAFTNNNTNLNGGSAIVTVTDANGCVFVEEFIVEEPSALTIEISVFGNECFGNVASVDVVASGGVAPYDISTMDSGLFTTVVVTDANGCTLTEDFEIVSQDPITVQGNISDVLCFGEASGGIVLTDLAGGNPPFTFAWNNGFTTSSLIGLVAGDYSVTITDANGCSVIQEYTVFEPSELTLTSEINNAGGNDNSIDIEVTGGTMPYSYSWSTGETTQDISNLPIGNYEVNILDANDCVLTADFDVISTATATIAELSSLNVFPVPADQVLNIEAYFSEAVSLNVEVYGLDGSRQIVPSQDFSAQIGLQKNIIDVSQLGSGIYMLVLTSENGVVAKRFVKL